MRVAPALTHRRNTPGDLLSDKMGPASRRVRKGVPAAAFWARDGAISLLTLENIVSPGGTVSTQSGEPDAHLLATSRQGTFTTRPFTLRQS